MKASNQKLPAKKKAKKRSKAGSNVALTLKILLLIFILVFFVAFLVFYVKYGRIILKMQQDAKTIVWQSTEDNFREYQTSMFFDVNGKVISSLSGERELYYVNYEDMPKDVIDAVVTIEDKRYFEHEGVDLIANVRAAVALIRHKGQVTQGGSTITQQLAKNIFLTNEVSVERKLKEIFIASEMEKKYTKKQILEFYLNNIYYASGYYGIQAAAKGYFNKSVSELTLSEAAFLSAIPNSPTYYNPVYHIDRTYERRNRILKQMYEDGIITKDAYDDAMDEKIKIINQEEKSNDYVETYVYKCTIEALMKQEGFQFKTSFSSDEEKEIYDTEYSEKYEYYRGLLKTGGYRVYTSIDLEQQAQLQKAIDDNLAGFTSTTQDGIYEMQGAAVCIDNETGFVAAIVGGRSQENQKYALNRAYQSYRQPGSSIKPIIVYAPYFELGHNPEEYVMDQKFEGGPRNSNGVYSGKITIRRAVEQSKNTIAWQLFDILTPHVGISYLEHMGFKKVGSYDENMAASLGGLTYGASCVEMASAYSALCNDGVYKTPTCVIKIMDSKGEEVLVTELEKKQIYEVQAARIMTDVMTGVIKNGTAKGLGISGITAAAKTGTTSDKKDGWFVGYSSYYTTAVWVGCDYPKTIDNLYGSTYPGYIWRDFMNVIHEGKVDQGFQKFEDVWSKEEEKEPEELEEDELESEEPIIDEDDTVDPPEIEEPSDEEEDIREPEDEPEDDEDMNDFNDGSDEVPEDEPESDTEEIPDDLPDEPDEPEEDAPEEDEDFGEDNTEDDELE